MRLTTERKVCAGVLSLAAAALGVDRLILGGATGPAAASAELLVGEAGRSAGGDAPSTTSSVPTAGNVPVAHQLAMLRGGAAGVDGFVPPQRWRVAIEQAEKLALERKDAPSDDQTDPALRKFKRHQLTAILMANGSPVRALVKVSGDEGRSSSRVVELGEELDGFTLTDLDQKAGKAKFRDVTRGMEASLALPKPGDETVSR